MLHQVRIVLPTIRAMSGPVSGESAGQGFPTSATLIELPLAGNAAHPSPVYLLVHVTHFKDRALLVWCGEAGGEASRIAALKDGGDPIQQALPAGQPKSSLFIEENPPPASSQNGNVAGPPEMDERRPVTGLLARDWSVSMTSRNPNVSAPVISWTVHSI